LVVDLNLNDFNVDLQQKKIFTDYAKKLGYNEDRITTLFDVLDTLREILERNKVKDLARIWDKEGSRLSNGKVVLPDGFEKVLNEIVKDNQLLLFFLPEGKGGMGFTELCQGIISEIIARYDVSLQIMTLISLSVIDPLVLYHKQDYENIIDGFATGERLGYVAFSEPEAGSNLENVKSTSEKSGEDYILNGTKIWISNGGYANTGLFLAKNMVDGKAEGTNVFLVDNLEGITTERLEEKSGLHASPTAQLRFENVTVPKEYLIAEGGQGYQKVLERLMGMRVGVSFQGIALAKRSYELAYEYANNRVTFGKPIINYPEVSRKLEQMATNIPRMEEYGYRAAYALDRYKWGWIPVDVGAGGKDSAEKQAASMIPGVARGGLAHYFVSASKVYTSEIVNQITYDATQIFGGNGFVSEFDVNRIMRDARVLSVYEGTSEIHQLILSRAQQALQLIPNFKNPYNSYENSTIYENILFERFPKMKNII
jgi:alkylation response protein AidB-like acyl-CoA dehydrogenase